MANANGNNMDYTCDDAKVLEDCIAADAVHTTIRNFRARINGNGNQAVPAYVPMQPRLQRRRLTPTNNSFRPSALCHPTSSRCYFSNTTNFSVPTNSVVHCQNTVMAQFMHTNRTTNIYINQATRITQPPITQPPITKPPFTQPPITKPPITQPPITKPPITQPPITKPPITQPPTSSRSSTRPAPASVRSVNNLEMRRQCILDASFLIIEYVKVLSQFLSKTEKKNLVEGAKSPNNTSVIEVLRYYKYRCLSLVFHAEQIVKVCRRMGPEEMRQVAKQVCAFILRDKLFKIPNEVVVKKEETANAGQVVALNRPTTSKEVKVETVLIDD